jgi:hypothetical protein
MALIVRARASSVVALILVAGVGLGACDRAYAPPVDSGLDNPIFSGSTPVRIAVPGIGDTTSTTPDFAWTSTGSRWVFVGIFTQDIVVKDGQIENPGDNVWAWHSGLGTGREGSVRFADGRTVIGGILQTGTAPTALAPNRPYFWAVWAWSDNAVSVAESSQEGYFFTK